MMPFSFSRLRKVAKRGAVVVIGLWPQQTLDIFMVPAVHNLQTGFRAAALLFRRLTFVLTPVCSEVDETSMFGLSK